MHVFDLIDGRKEENFFISVQPPSTHRTTSNDMLVIMHAATICRYLEKKFKFKESISLNKKKS